MRGLCVTLGADGPEALCARVLGGTAHAGVCGSGPAGSARSLRGPRKMLWPRGSRRTGAQQGAGSEKGQDGTALPLPTLECRTVSWANGPGLEDDAQWPHAQFAAQMSVLRKSCNPSQDNLTHQLSLV